MQRPSVAVAFALLLVGPGLAGCIEELQRRQLDAGWQADVEIAEAPFEERHGAPAMVVASGPVELPEDANITVTGFDAELEGPNATIPLQAMRVHTSAGTLRAGQASGELQLSPEEPLTVTFVPDDDAERRVNPEEAWNASVEILWRHREGTDFDAGRLEANRTDATPSRLPGLGVGVVEREEGRVSGLVFEAIGEGELPQATSVEALQVGGGSSEPLEELSANVSHANGTALVTFEEGFDVPDGNGYVLFRLGAVNGTASTPLGEAEDPLPGPGAALTMALGALAALGLARRRDP